MSILIFLPNLFFRRRWKFSWGKKKKKKAGSLQTHLSHLYVVRQGKGKREGRSLSTKKRPTANLKACSIKGPKLMTTFPR